MRLLYVWWAGKPEGDGPMQLLLSGIGAETMRMSPSDAGPDKDPDAQDISEDYVDMGAVSHYRFRLNERWSCSVWSLLCDPKERM